MGDVPAGLSALVGAFLTLGIAVWWPDPSPGSADLRSGQLPDSAPMESWSGRLRIPQVATRIVAVGLLGVSVAAGRVGLDDQLRNVAPALVVGFAWPALLAGSMALGPVWRWLDPWDTLARPWDRPPDAGGASGDVWAAALVAAAWVWYLAAFEDALQPRSIGIALGAYSILTVGGALLLGRERWFSRTEVFGLLFAWAARLPRGRLPRWTPPAGAGAVLGILAGGLVFGLVRHSPLWVEQSFAENAGTLASAGVLGSALGGLLLMEGADRWANRAGVSGSVGAAAVPVVVGLALALALANDRLLTSAQVLPIVAGDPFGFGWDLFGTADWVVRTNLLGGNGRTLLQAALVAAGGVAGATVLSLRVPGRGRVPAALAVAATTTAGIAFVTLG